MDFAVLPPVREGVSADPEWMAGFARHAETCGFESVVLVEHAVIAVGYEEAYPYSGTGRMPLPETCPIPDPLDMLAYLAGVTARIGLATGVLVLPNHHPVVLAKRAATVDVVSGGRLRLCVGVGWMREEVEACGADFSTRGRRADESIDVLRALWADSGEAGASHEGEFFSFSGLQSYPKPVRGTVPLHIGGHSAAAATRAGRRGDGLQPLGLGGSELAERVALMRHEAEDTGRDPEALQLSLGGLLSATDPEDVEAAAESGASRMVLAPTSGGDLQAVRDELSAFAERHGMT